MTLPSERRVELRAEMANLLWELHMSKKLISDDKSQSKDLKVFAIITITLCSVILIWFLGRPLSERIIVPAFLGIILSCLLLAAERFSLGNKIKSCEEFVTRTLLSMRASNDE